MSVATNTSGLATFKRRAGEEGRTILHVHVKQLFIALQDPHHRWKARQALVNMRGMSPEESDVAV